MMVGVKAFYVDRRMSSKRYRNNAANASVHNLCRLLDNVRFTLGKGIQVCGLEVSSSLVLEDSQRSGEVDGAQQSDEEPPRLAAKRPRPRFGSRKRAVLRRTKRMKLAAQPCETLLPAASVFLESWSDLEMSQRSEPADAEAIAVCVMANWGE